MADSSFNDSESDNVVSMVDVLHDEQLLEEDADAVLGASDAHNCTYLQGYVPRQAVYACSTCIANDSDPAGVCLACSLECHDGHNLVELYTKRSFRCDCGNSKFTNSNNDVTWQCKLCPDKLPINPDNHYNHNYRGLYCRCERPYPDPDDSVDDVMLQCVICEDWFHGRHLGPVDTLHNLPPLEDFEEMTCDICTDRCSFLRYYAQHFAGLTASCVDETSDIDVIASISDQHSTGDTKVSATSVDKTSRDGSDSQGDAMLSATSVVKTSEDDDSASQLKDAAAVTDTVIDNNCKTVVTTMLITNPDGAMRDTENSRDESTTVQEVSNVSDGESCEVLVNSGSKNKWTSLQVISGIKDEPTSLPASGSTSMQAVIYGESTSGSTETAGNSHVKCCLAQLPDVVCSVGALFWRPSWRTHLCRCADCMLLYESLEVKFLIDESDTISAYEQQGKLKSKSSPYQQGLTAFSTKLDRVQQMEMLHGYTDLKSELTAYLQKFAENKKVVREQDVKDFFEQLASRKRRRLSSDSTMPPHQYYSQ